MIKDHNEIKKITKKKWPKLYHIWLDQKRLWLPEKDEVVKLVEKHSVSKMQYRDETMECETYALLLWAGIKRHLVELAEAAYSSGEDVPDRLKSTWAFGFARGMNFDSWHRGVPHALNFAITSDVGIVLIEPQTNDMWTPEKASDEDDDNFVFFITM